MRQSDPDEMHVQASEEERNFSQAKEVVEILQLQHPLVPKEPETVYATVRVRRHGTRYTSPTRARKSSILGASEVFY